MNRNILLEQDSSHVISLVGNKIYKKTFLLSINDKMEYIMKSMEVKSFENDVLQDRKEKSKEDYFYS